MTTPVERLRALRCGEQLLQSILAASVPAELRHRAARLIDRYPHQPQLDTLLSEPNSWLSREVARALFDAGLLFEQLARPEHSGFVSRPLLQYAMRHFPSRDNGWYCADDFELFRVAELLADEEPPPTGPDTGRPARR